MVCSSSKKPNNSWPIRTELKGSWGRRDQLFRVMACMPRISECAQTILVKWNQRTINDNRSLQSLDESLMTTKQVITPLSSTTTGTLLHACFILRMNGSSPTTRRGRRLRASEEGQDQRSKANRRRFHMSSLTSGSPTI